MNVKTTIIHILSGFHITLFGLVEFLWYIHFSNITMKFLRIQKLCFYYFGYTFQPNESKFVRFFALLCWVSLLSCAICQFHFAVKHKTDIKLVTDSLATVLTCILTLTKVIRTFFKRSRFYDIIFELEVMWFKGLYFIRHL